MDEGRRKAPAAPAARCLAGLRPPARPPPLRPPGRPLRRRRPISGTCITSPTRCSQASRCCAWWPSTWGSSSCGSASACPAPSWPPRGAPGPRRRRPRPRLRRRSRAGRPSASEPSTNRPSSTSLSPCASTRTRKDRRNKLWNGIRKVSKN